MDSLLFAMEKYTAIGGVVERDLASTARRRSCDDFRTRTGSFADGGDDAWAATVDYGDGSGARPLALNADKTKVFEYQPDPADPAKTILAVGGTAGVDTAIVKPRPDGAVEVVLNDVVLGTFTPTGGVYVFGQAGNDHAIVTTALPVP